VSDSFLVRKPAAADDHTFDSLMRAVAPLARAVTDVEFTVEDLARDLCLVAVRVLDVEGARLIPAQRDHRSSVQVGVPDRWPRAVDRSASAGPGSVTAFTLSARGCSWGVLHLYRSPSKSWTERDLAVARLFADIAASYVAMATMTTTQIAGSELRPPA
jgi:GAF domain-containing protein